MAERLRRVKVDVLVGTNKRTSTATFELDGDESIEEFIERAKPTLEELLPE